MPAPAKWNGNHALTNDALTNMPDHGSIVGSVIAGWSLIEANLGRTFAYLIGAKQPFAMSMYLTIRSFDLQRELLQTAADERISKRDALAFRAALVVLNRIAKIRHRFAHWMWGASADPSVVGLILVAPRDYGHVTAARIKFTRSRRGKIEIEKVGYPELVSGLPRLERKHFEIYDISKLKEELAEMERGFRIAEALRELVASKGKRRHAIYRWLMNEADIRKAHDKAKSAPLPTP